MTSSEGGFRHPRDESRSLSSSNTAPSDAQSNSRKDSPQPLERRLSNVIDVQDPTRIIECSHLERQRKFQYLVRRYVWGSTCQLLLITHAHEPAATYHRYYTAVRAPIVIPQHVSHATSAMLPSLIDRRPFSLHELWPTSLPARATPTADSAPTSSRSPRAHSRLKARPI